MVFLLSFFWYVRTARALLFVLYLWQVKEYHIGRFLDHFTTLKGRRVLFHPFALLKLVLLGMWFAAPGTALLLLLTLYVAETALFFRALRRKTFLAPVLTRKTAVLLASAGVAQVSFLAAVLTLVPELLFLAFLSFDLLSLVIGSLVVLFWQPYAVFERNRILKRAAAKRRSMEKLRVVGVTGSYGKTSTKEFLSHVLSSRFTTLKTPEHRNSEMGIAHTILYDLTDEHQIFVCEMGAYSKGGIKLLANMAQPSLGVITGVNSQHLALFGSEANLISAEGGGELVSSLPADGTLVLNYESVKLREYSHWLQLWNPSLGRYIWCAVGREKDVWAKDVTVTQDRLSFTLAAGKEKAKVVSSLAGGWNTENMVLAAAVALELGMSLREIAGALSSIPPELSSLRLEKGKGFWILDSSYSANLNGVKAALEHLKLWKGSKIVVMPPLIELGPEGKRAHEEIGEKIAETCDYAFLAGRDYRKELLAGARKGGMKEDRMVFAEDAKEIAGRVLALTKEGDAVLLEGRVPPTLLSLLKS